MELNKNNMQTTPIGLHFHQLSDFYISSLGGVKKKKCPNWDKWIWPDESWAIVYFETANLWKIS